ncbi:alpha/beta hydrolase [Micromonospora sp. NPDC050200]|uniref:alpha/beta fold hydrolase n=1 Tax=Micromonospora sp. NPDC050200 TaxID=3155664 RepID=UPI0033F49E6A
MRRAAARGAGHRGRDVGAVPPGDEAEAGAGSGAEPAAPTLVVGGAKDPVAPPAWRAQVTRLVPHARAVPVPGAAHNLVTTAPQQVADAIRTLLAADPDKVDPCASETRRSVRSAGDSAAS